MAFVGQGLRVELKASSMLQGLHKLGVVGVCGRLRSFVGRELLLNYAISNFRSREEVKHFEALETRLDMKFRLQGPAHLQIMSFVVLGWWGWVGGPGWKL